MALGQSLQQKLLQKLSPQQIQLMKLLQVPTANLEERIKEELEENPALEMGEDEDTKEADDEIKDEFETEEEEDFDLVITDIMMNNLGGLELLEHIRAHEKLAQLPVILVTAKPEKEVSDILDHPLNFYLGKPFSYDNLIATVNSALGNN